MRYFLSILLISSVLLTGCQSDIEKKLSETNSIIKQQQVTMKEQQEKVDDQKNLIESKQKDLEMTKNDLQEKQIESNAYSELLSLFLAISNKEIPDSSNYNKSEIKNYYDFKNKISSVEYYYTFGNNQYYKAGTDTNVFLKLVSYFLFSDNRTAPISVDNPEIKKFVDDGDLENYHKSIIGINLSQPYSAFGMDITNIYMVNDDNSIKLYLKSMGPYYVMDVKYNSDEEKNLYLFMVKDTFNILFNVK